MNKLSVSITIPTYNSAPFLERCLDAIRAQSYQSLEVNIVDGNSKDTTVDIAKKYEIPVLFYSGALLGARYEGVKNTQGKYILLLDSDQILERDAIERALSMISARNLDMLVFEEDVCHQDSFLDKLFHYDRKLVHAVKDFDPITGVMLPRFYKATLLKKAFEEIPSEIREKVGGQDHAIIYYEVSKISRAVDLLPLAVRHIEPSSLKVIWKKFYRWGATSVDARFGKYDEFLSRKEGFRKGLFKKGLWIASIASIFLLLIKGIPYKLGQFLNRNHG